MFLLFVGALIAIPYLFQDKLEAIAKKEINKNVNATVDFSGTGVSFFRDFPYLTFSLNNLSVVNKAPFKGDTLASLGRFSVSLAPFSLIGDGAIDLKAVSLRNADIKVKVLEDGTANYDIAKATEETDEELAEEGAAEYSVSLQRYSLENVNLIYDDIPGDTYARIVNLNHSGSGDFTQDLFNLNTETFIEGVTVMQGGTAYTNNMEVEAELDLEIDNANSKYTFKENTIRLNQLFLGFDGSVNMKDEEAIGMDVNFYATETAFRNILSMVPAVYAKDFEDVQTEGTLALTGYAKGEMVGERYPAFGIKIEVKNGMFQYPDLPEKVSDIQMLTNINSPGGDLDNTTVDISKLNMNMAGDPVRIKAKIKTPVSDPDIDAALKAKMNLANVPKYYPLGEGESISGMLDADVTAKGRLSAIENEQYQNFNASGKLTLKDMDYTSPDLPVPFNIAMFDLQFNPTNVRLNELTATAGKSDFSATGYLNNVIAYAMAGDPLKGRLTLNSKLLDLNEFMVETEGGTTDEPAAEEMPGEVEVGTIPVPANLNLRMDARFDKILFEDLTMTNAKGTVVVRDEAVRITNLQANALKGYIAITGAYSTKGGGQPDMDFSYNITNVDINETITTFNTVEKIAPVAKLLNGRFSSNMDMRGKLGENMEPDLQSLFGNGKVEINNAKLSGFKPFNTLADKFKMEQLRSLEFNDIWTVIEVRDGRVFVEPFDVKVNDLTMTVSGSNGLDESIDYSVVMDVPRSKMGAGANSYVDGLVNQANIPGLNANSLPDKLRFDVGITGKFDDPKVNVKMARQQGGSVKEQLKDQLNEEKEKVKEEVKEKVEETKEEVKEKAEEKKEEIKEEAKEKAEEKKEEVKDKLKDKIGWP